MALQNQYGLGFSPLSIKYVSDHAFEQEAVANKEVGLYGIVVDEDRHAVSAQYVARSKYQMDTFVNRLIADNTIGRLYKLTVDDQLVRTIQDNTTNLLEGTNPDNVTINYGVNYIKGVRFNIDLDWVVKNRSALAYNGTIKAEIVMKLQIGSYSKYMTITDTIPIINSTAYALDYTGLDDAVGDVILTLESITIKADDDFDYDENILALYDILLAVIPMRVE